MQNLIIYGAVVFEQKMLNLTMLSQTKAVHYQVVKNVARRENTVSAVIIVHFL
jgi:hypothetical protein